MLVDYFYWQYVVAPHWLLQVIWNLQRALVRFFSIKLMLRTLVAHWHKDSMPFQGGTLSQLGMTMLWNIISRAVGFLFRSFVLLTWLAVETVFIVLAILLVPIFLVWPALVIIGFATGLALLTMGL